MRLVITGGAGFIGSHLCDYFVDRGHQVVAVDNFLTGRSENLAHLEREARFTLIRQDIVESLRVEGPVDWVLNFASPASPADYMRHAIETLCVGAWGTLHALELALEKGARLLHASTSECYGDPAAHPQPETYWGNVNPIGPRSVYDEAKRYAEALTMAFHRHRGLDIRMVRIFNTYGPRMKLQDGRVVPNLIGQALAGRPLTVFGDGSQTRSFCYISDLVDGIARMMECNHQLPVNLGNPDELSILEFARKIQRLIGTRDEIEFLPLPEDDPRQRQPDITKARQLLGWEPKVSLDEGLRLTIEFFRGRLALARP